MALCRCSVSAISGSPLGEVLRRRSRCGMGTIAMSGRKRSGSLWLGITPVMALVLVRTLGGCAWGAEGLVVEQARLGNVFSSHEVVQIPVQSVGDRVDWRVEDFSGTTVAEGTAWLSHGYAVIEPRLGRIGYFELELEAWQDNAPLASAETAFAVIAPPNATPPEESPFGVATHFAQGWDRDVFPLIARAGIDHIRDEQYWSTVEPEAGRFVFPNDYRAYMAEARSHGLVPLIIMSYANDNYDEGLTPYTDAGLTGYARYGRAILEEYGDQIRVLEVWNEYNGSFADGPAAQDRAVHYTKMLEQAYREIKAVRPEVRVLGGAAVHIALPYLEEVFRLGGLEYMDGVVVHPYGREPEGLGRELAALNELIERYSGGVRKSIWVTEFGRWDHSPWGRRRSASYLVRTATVLLSENVERMYWYLMRDYLDFETMGLVRDVDSPFGRYTPAPAYVAYANVIRQLAGARYVRREPTDPRTHVYVFERGGEEIRVSWSTAPSSRVDFEAGSPLTVVDIVGDERTVPPADGAVSLMLTEDPVYLKGPVREVREHRRDSILAWSEHDFGVVQGAGGWHYGYYDGDGEGQGAGIGPSGPYTDDDFELLGPVESVWERYWGDRELGPIAVGGDGAHPSAAGDRPVWAVRRWVSGAAGTLHISGTIGNGTEGDGTRAAILVDGIEVFSAEVGGPDGRSMLEYAVAPVVNEGSVVDFVVTPGPGTDVDFDATSFTALITLPIAAASEEDFGTVQGGNGWHYGYYDGDGQGEGDGAEPAGPFTDDDFARLPLIDGDAGRSWHDPRLGPVRIERDAAHPSAAKGQPVWAVRRWESDVDGSVRITGKVVPTSAQGDGTSVRILVDGLEVFSADVGGPGDQGSIEYALSVQVRKGSLVDFAITPGPASNVDFDATVLTAVIHQLGEAAR
jgi:Glycosyl hydrolase catalytic core